MRTRHQIVDGKLSPLAPEAGGRAWLEGLVVVERLGTFDGGASLPFAFEHARRFARELAALGAERIPEAAALVEAAREVAAGLVGASGVVSLVGVLDDALALEVLGAHRATLGEALDVATVSRSVGAVDGPSRLVGDAGRAAAADRAARGAGRDAALLFTRTGRVAGLHGHDLCWLDGDRLITIPRGDASHAGEERAALEVMAREDGLIVAERALGVDDLFGADAVIAVGVGGARRVRSLDGQALGASPRCEALLARFEAVARGEDPSHPEWITRVAGR